MGILTSDIPEGYISGLSRRRVSRDKSGEVQYTVSHLYKGTFSDSAADAVAVGSHHSRAQLVQDLEGGFVSGEAKLPLKLHSRKAGRHAGNEISAPKPYCKRCSGPFHHGSGRQSRVLPACPATQNARSRRETVGLARRLAERADELFGPAHAFQVSGASGVIREQFLKLRQGLGERQVFPFENVGEGRHGSDRQAQIFGAHPFFAQVVHPLDQNQRVGLNNVSNSAGNTVSIAAKLRVPSSDKITGREPFRRGGPCRSVGHLRSPRFNGRILAWVSVGVKRIGMNCHKLSATGLRS